MCIIFRYILVISFYQYTGFHLEHHKSCLNILLAWTEWGIWSQCESVDLNEECGPNSTTWRIAKDCKQESDSTEVDEFWCGEIVYHIQSCYLYCRGKNLQLVHRETI